MATSTHDIHSAALARFRDENEQLRTALESAHDEIGRLASDRERLLHRLTVHSRDLHRADAVYREAAARQVLDLAGISKEERISATEEELRVAVEEMQVLTEELEVANQQLIEQNAALDRRVDARTAELASANAALAASEASSRTVADLVPDFLWRSDAAGQVRWLSRR